MLNWHLLVSAANRSSVPFLFDVVWTSTPIVDAFISRHTQAYSCMCKSCCLLKLSLSLSPEHYFFLLRFTTPVLAHLQISDQCSLSNLSISVETKLTQVSRMFFHEEWKYPSIFLDSSIIITHFRGSSETWNLTCWYFWLKWSRKVYKVQKSQYFFLCGIFLLCTWTFILVQQDFFELQPVAYLFCGDGNNMIIWNFL